MKKTILFLFLLLTSWNSFSQSSPQFVYQPSSGQTAGAVPLSFPGGRKSQSMYKPSEFPGLGAGTITAVYLRSRVDRSYPIGFRNMTVKMGHIPVNESGPNPDTIPYSVWPLTLFPCNTVFFDSLFTIPTPIDSADWIKFPLQTPFQFNGTDNFIVEFSQDSMAVDPFQVVPNLTTIAYKVSLRTYDVAPYPIFSGNWLTPGHAAVLNLLGLDMAPNSVKGIADLKDLQLYPNPAKDLVRLEWDAGSREVKELSVTMSSLTGAAVWQQSYLGVRGKFSKSIDLSHLPKGIYLATIEAEGEKITKKLVLQ